jgi:histidinol dehydrogenase
MESFRAAPKQALRSYFLEKGSQFKAVLRSQSDLDRLADNVSFDDVAALEILSDRLDRLNKSFVATLELPSVRDVTFDCKVIQRVGIYVPSRLPATAITYLSAARAAGVPDVTTYLAQDRDGEPDPLSVVAANKYGARVLCGPARFGFLYLAFGDLDSDLSPCDLVCGPCGWRLNVLKHLAALTAGAAVDMWAGPSAILIIADETADWNQVKLDLLSQNEHGPDSRAELVLIGAAAESDWLRFAGLINDARITVTPVHSLARAIAVANAAAPEIVEVWTESPQDAAKSITAAGVVYLRCSAAQGDYGCVGRGCGDPTDGLSKAQSGLSPLTFLRMQPVVSSDGLTESLRAAAVRIAAYENLRCHQAAIVGSALI